MIFAPDDARSISLITDQEISVTRTEDGHTLWQASSGSRPFTHTWVSPVRDFQTTSPSQRKQSMVLGLPWKANPSLGVWVSHYPTYSRSDILRIIRFDRACDRMPLRQFSSFGCLEQDRWSGLVAVRGIGEPSHIIVSNYAIYLHKCLSVASLSATGPAYGTRHFLWAWAPKYLRIECAEVAVGCGEG